MHVRASRILFSQEINKYHPERVVPVNWMRIKRRIVTIGQLVVSYRREPRGEKRRKEIGEKRLPLLAPTDSNTVPDAGNMVARDATATDFLINR